MVARRNGRRDVCTGPSNSTDRKCLGELDSETSVPGGTRLQGCIAAPAAESSSPNLVVLDAAGRRIGLGLVGLHRPELEKLGVADPEWVGFVAYVRGAPTPLLALVFLANDGVNAVCRLTRPPTARRD